MLLHLTIYTNNGQYYTVLTKCHVTKLYRRPFLCRNNTHAIMKGAGLLFKISTYFVLFVLYIYLFGWDSVQRFIRGEIVIERKVVHSQAIKPPGNDLLCSYLKFLVTFCSQF